MKTFLTALLISMFALSALAQTPTTSPAVPVMPETVSVTGTGKVTVTPDRFVFNVGVQTIAPAVQDAVNRNNARVASVIEALVKAGAKREDIQTSNFNIWPQQEHREGRPGDIVSYQVTNNITVRSAKVADAGRLLGVAVGAGVNNASGIQFEVKDPEKGRDEGLKRAMADARAKATLLAQAAGRTLGPAITITEGSGQYRPPYPVPVAQAAMAMESRVSDVPVEAGQQEMSYMVSVTYGLR
jgi:uncharacterized protein YggE